MQRSHVNCLPPLIATGAVAIPPWVILVIIYVLVKR
jgi:hypothetical protein